MTAIKLAGAWTPHAVELRSDEYVSASLTFTPETWQPRIVITVDGTSGGWLEMVVSQHDGAVEQLTVTARLPEVGAGRHLDSATPVVQGQVPCFDLDELEPYAYRAGFDMRVDITCALGEFLRSGGRVLSLGDGSAAVRLLFEGVEFGFDHAGELVDVVLRPYLLQRATTFS